MIFRGLPDEERIVRVARCANEEIELELGLGFSHYFVIFRGLPDEERIVRVARCANEEIELELGLGFLGWYSDVHRGVSQLQDIQLVSGELKNIRHCFLSSSFFVCVARCADKEIELKLTVAVRGQVL